MEYSVVNCKIVSNIYENTIIYELLDEANQWSAIDENDYSGKLTGAKYSQEVFFNKEIIEEVIRIISEDFGEGESSRIKIYFEGSSKEYETLKEVCDSQFSENVELQSMERYLLDAKDIIKGVEGEFKKIQKLIQKYENVKFDEIQKFSAGDWESDCELKGYQLLEKFFKKIENTRNIIKDTINKKEKDKNSFEVLKEGIEKEVQNNEEEQREIEQRPEEVNQNIDSSWEKLKKFYIEGFPRACSNLKKNIQKSRSKLGNKDNLAGDEQEFFENEVSRSGESIGYKLKEFYVGGIKNIAHNFVFSKKEEPSDQTEVGKDKEVNRDGETKRKLREITEKIENVEKEIRELEDDSKELEKFMKWLEWKEKQ